MQSRNRMFDDLARVTNGAASVFSGFRDEAEAAIRQRVERLLAEMDVVSREEFEAVRELAANARAEQDALAARVTALEARLDELTTTKPVNRKPRKNAAKTSDAPAADGNDSPAATE